MRPARVQPVNLTSATSTGSAQTASRAWSAGSGAAHGEVAPCSGARRPGSPPRTPAGEPGPARAGVGRAAALLYSDRQRADLPRPVPLAGAPAADHRLLPQDVLDLAPRARPFPRLVAGVEALGHDALQTVLDGHLLDVFPGRPGERGPRLARGAGDRHLHERAAAR